MICGYGCQKEARYPPRKGMTKWCCERHYNKCSFQIKLKTKNAQESGKLLGRTPWNKGKKDLQVAWNKGKSWPEKSKKKMSTSSKLTIIQIKERYPFFSKIEALRYNPDNKKEIQANCKNHNCENSREKGGWFTLTYIQLYERIRALERPHGMIDNNFYCSQKCKDECILYYLRNDPYKIKEDKELPYTPEEYQVYRENVMERENGLCEYCGEKAEHVHHIKPKKLESFFALDPDFGIATCKICHYKYGHKDECSTGNLAKKICNK